MANASILVVEVGGTTVRAGAFDPTGHCLLRRGTAATPNHLGRPTADGLHEDVLAAMREVAAGVTGTTRPVQVVVAYPGPLDARGRALAAPTVLGGSRDRIDLPAEAALLWPGARIIVLNDVTAAGFRYVAQGMRDFAIVTVGSGIGHKVFRDGVPLIDARGHGGEIGHLRVDYSASAAMCDCGGRGHVGGIASGRGTVNRLRDLALREPERYAASPTGRSVPDPRELSGPDVARAYRENDPFVDEVVTESIRRLGQALAAIHLDTGPDRFVLVGGFALALGEPYRKAVAGALRDACWDIGQDWDEMVLLGEADEDSALYGGAYLAPRAMRS